MSSYNFIDTSISTNTTSRSHLSSRRRHHQNHNNNDHPNALTQFSSDNHHQNDNYSLTYSASSSEAGQSTDSSEVTDIEFLTDIIAREQAIHLLEQYRAVARMNSLTHGGGSVEEGSAGGVSLGCSTGSNNNSCARGHCHPNGDGRHWIG